MQWICTLPYRILPTQCVVNNPGSCWHYHQSSGWCYQALHHVYCVVCCVFIIFVGCILCYVLWALYSVYWARLYTTSTVWCVYVSCFEFALLPSQCPMYVFCCAALLPVQYAMYVLFVLHYCHRRVLCVSCLCLHHLPVQGAMYVLFCVALLPVLCAMYVLFVLQYCQRSVLYMSCLCCTTASAVCRCWTLPAQCAAVEHCQRSEPCRGYDKSSFHFNFHTFYYFYPF